MVLLPEAFAGRSLGKLITRLQVTSVSSEHTSSALRRRLFAKCSPCLLALVSMITPQLWLALLAVAAATVLWLGAIPPAVGQFPIA